MSVSLSYRRYPVPSPPIVPLFCELFVWWLGVDRVCLPCSLLSPVVLGHFFHLYSWGFLLIAISFLSSQFLGAAIAFWFSPHHDCVLFVWFCVALTVVSLVALFLVPWVWVSLVLCCLPRSDLVGFPCSLVSGTGRDRVLPFSGVACVIGVVALVPGIYES